MYFAAKSPFSLSLSQSASPTFAKPLVRLEPFFPDILTLSAHKSQNKIRNKNFGSSLDVIYVINFSLFFFLLCNVFSWQLLRDVEKGRQIQTD